VIRQASRPIDPRIGVDKAPLESMRSVPAPSLCAVLSGFRSSVTAPPQGEGQCKPRREEAGSRAASLPTFSYCKITALVRLRRRAATLLRAGRRIR
jgi:hypothetical protein